MQYIAIQSEESQNILQKKKIDSITKKTLQLKQHLEQIQNLQNASSLNLQKSNFFVSYVKNKYVYSGIIGFFILVLCLIALYREITLKVERFPIEIYNQHLKGQKFGNFSQLYINCSKTKMSQYKSVQQRPFYFYQIQVGSVLDFGISELIDFDQLQQYLYKKLAYQVVYFQYKQSLQRQNNFFINYFQNQKQIQNYLDQLVLNSRAKQTTIQYNLGIQLSKYPNDPKILHAEYYYSNKKYGIGNHLDQKPICLFSPQFNILKKQDRYIKYFQQIQNLNYTNFHIVYVDDFSEQGSFQEVYRYLKYSQLRIRNRIKIIHNLQKLGVLGNMNFWMKKYCQSDDIIIVLDADDIFVGRQVFKIINSIYQTPSVWYAYSKYIKTRRQQYDLSVVPIQEFQKGYSSTFLGYKTQEYRISFDWQTSAMRSFRKKLVDAIPISSFIQYYYQESLEVIWPRFYQTGADMFIVHSQLQAAGNHRVVYIQDYFYLYYFIDYISITKDCHRQRQLYDGYKSNIKTPLKLIARLGQKSQIVKNYSVNQQKLKIIQKAFNESVSCKKKLLTNSD